jgi:glycosyltransferase involved in cell wall biosynthesis
MPRANLLLPHSSWPPREHMDVTGPTYNFAPLFSRACALAGYDVTLTPPRSGGVVKSGIAGAADLRGYDLAVVGQAGPAISTFWAKITWHAVPTLFYLWKIPGAGSQHFAARVNDAIHASIIRSARLVVVITEHQERMLADRWPRTPRLFIHCPVDTNWWTPGEADTDVFAALGLKPGEFLLCVGDIDRDEDAPALVAKKLGRPLIRATRDPRTATRARTAFARIGAPHCHCLLNVAWPQLRDLYRCAYATLITPTVSFHPAGCTSLTEAMSCGSVIVFPNNATAQSYFQDGVNGLLVDKLDADGLLEGCMKMRNEEHRAKLRTNARQFAEQYLTFEHGAQRVATALKTSAPQ